LLNAGAHETVTDALPETPRTAVGALGAFIGTTPLEGDDAALCPARLVATTVNVYGVPSVRPLTEQLSAAVMQDFVPGDAVTVYDVTAPPPLSEGSAQ
jgi:hypothetical protein